MPIAASMPGAEVVSNACRPKSLRLNPGCHCSRPSIIYRAAICLIAILAGTGIAAHLALRFGFHASSFAQFLPLYVTLILGGLPLVFHLIRRVFELEFGSDLLAGISIVVSALMGQYLVGSIVILMLSGGTALENYATRHASSVLKALAMRMPKIGASQNGKRNHGH